MDLETLKEYCLTKKGAIECYPFDEENLVFKVGSKMFALVNINQSPLRVNLKCDPFMAEDLRRDYTAIIPGYHMNKRHWNTVILDDSLPIDKIFFLIDLSYDLVFKGLRKTEKENILQKI